MEMDKKTKNNVSDSYEFGLMSELQKISEDLSGYSTPSNPTTPVGTATNKSMASVALAAAVIPLSKDNSFEKVCGINTESIRRVKYLLTPGSKDLNFAMKVMKSKKQKQEARARANEQQS